TGGGGSTGPGGPSPAAPSPGPEESPPPAPTTVEVSGQVLYTARSCRAGAASTAPLAGALLRLVPSTGPPVTARLDGAGRYGPTQVTGTGPIRAFAVTDGPRISVTPDTSPAQPYEIPLGPVTPGSSQTLLIGNGPGNTQPDPASGAASIFTRLDLAAQFAARVSPVELDEVRARWRYMADLTGWLGDQDGSQYEHPGNEIIVGGLSSGEKRDEWESFPLLHEYGHHVHYSVGKPPGTGGSHHFHSVHQYQPAVAWSEGFAHAFASAALDDPRLTLGCEVRMDLSAKPAVADDPTKAGVMLEAAPASAPHLAQHNETAVAGVIRGAALELEGGGLEAGMASLLDAMKRFKDKYHAPEDMLEVRDSLTEFADDDDAELQQRLGNAFDDHRLRWGFKAKVVSRDYSWQGHPGWLMLWTQGPSWTQGPVCDMSQPDTGPSSGAPAFTGPDIYSADGTTHVHGQAWGTTVGALPYSRHDECWLTVDTTTTIPPHQTLVQTLPYLDDQAHRLGKTTIYALWDCAHSSCSKS
ncbi:MAG: hypothetical protein ACRDJ5_02530, partial [Actinomycetota bacterium]